MKDMSKEIQKAYELWKNMNLTEEEREVAERRYKDMVALEHAKKYEYEQGRVEGEKLGLERGERLGLEKGEKQKQEEIAKEMIKEKLDIELIMKITKLSKEEIEKLN